MEMKFNIWCWRKSFDSRDRPARRWRPLACFFNGKETERESGWISRKAESAYPRWWISSAGCHPANRPEPASNSSRQQSGNREARGSSTAFGKTSLMMASGCFWCIVFRYDEVGPLCQNVCVCVCFLGELGGVSWSISSPFSWTANQKSNVTGDVVSLHHCCDWQKWKPIHEIEHETNKQAWKMSLGS